MSNIPDKGLKEPRINDRINTRTVRLVDQNGEMVGVVPTNEAIAMAVAAGLDLVEVSPNAEPPVCKILDYGKYKYEAQKKAKAARKNQKVIHIKEIKLRPNIDIHDYQVKAKAARAFLEEGDKVKVTLRFRGREVSHFEIGEAVLKRMEADLADLGKTEISPRMEGKQLMMLIVPK